LPSFVNENLCINYHIFFPIPGEVIAEVDGLVRMLPRGCVRCGRDGVLRGFGGNLSHAPPGRVMLS
jgi:hypothetical protein